MARTKKTEDKVKDNELEKLEKDLKKVAKKVSKKVKAEVPVVEEKAKKTTKRAVKKVKEEAPVVEEKVKKATKKAVAKAKEEAPVVEEKVKKTTKKATAKVKEEVPVVEEKVKKTTKRASKKIAEVVDDVKDEIKTGEKTKELKSKATKSVKKATTAAKKSTAKAKKEVEKEIPVVKEAVKKTTKKVAKKVKDEAPIVEKKVKKVTKRTAKKVIKEAEEIVEKATNKFIDIAEYYDLPYKYNKTVVKVLAQNPNTLFVYWEISDDDIEELKKQYGEDIFYKTRPVLIIHNLTDNYSFEVNIDDFANNWYVHVNDPKCNYSAELGRRPNNMYKIHDEKNNKDTDYINVSFSNTIEMPNDHVLFFNNGDKVYFKNVKTNKVRSATINKNNIKNTKSIYKEYDLQEENNSIDFTNPSSGNPTSNVMK